MSKAQHTPGPWKFESWSIFPEDDSSSSVCIFMRSAFSAPDEVIKANARLIAASPELLAACKAALDVFELDCSLQYGDITDRLIEAITNAGGQP